jgi:hypothetical protein
MIPEHSPACTETSLRALYAVKDALRRGALVEASNFVFDTLAIIQNEFDGCYRTDPVLPFMRSYFIELNTAISSIIKVTPEVKKEQAQRLISCIDQTLQDVSAATAALPVYHAEEGRPDRLDKEYLLSLYGNR